MNATTIRNLTTCIGATLLFVSCGCRAEDGAVPSQDTVATVNVYYLAAKGGDDNGSGSEGAPFATFAVALSKLNAGDTLVVKKGLYNIDKTYKLKCRLLGTKEKPITIRGEDGAVFKGLYDKATNNKKFGPDQYSGIVVRNSCWVTVENLEMKNNGVLFIGNKHITYRNCHIHSYSNYALITNGFDYLTVEGCKIHGSTVEHGIYLTSINTNVVIRNCEFYDTAVNGIHINGSGNRYILIEGNVFHHVSRDRGACITMMGARDVTVRNNIFFCNSGHIFTPTNKPGHGVEGGLVKPSNIEIYNNTFYQPAYGRKGALVVVAGTLTDWKVYNNVICTNINIFENAKPEKFVNPDFHDNIYSPAAGKMSDQLCKEKNGKYGVDVKFRKAPQLNDSECDLRLVDEKLNAKYGAYANVPQGVKLPNME